MMYFYLLIESDYSEDYEDGVESQFMHVYHDEKYTEEEFAFMCNQAIKNLKDSNEFIYNAKIADKLNEIYGFKKIQHIAAYEFER